jgi:hypothetical protein
MLADVRSKQQVARAIVVIVAVILLGPGMVLDSRLLSTVAGIVALVGVVVPIAWSVIGGPEQGKSPGAVQSCPSPCGWASRRLSSSL